MSTIDMSKEATARSAMKLALEALVAMSPSGPTGSLIWHQQMYAITALREALASEAIEQPAQYFDKVLYDGSSTAEALRRFQENVQPAPVAKPHEQELVAWLTEERYAEMHTPKWTPKIQQVFSKDGILESQTIQYAPQSKPVSYPPAQRTWVGLTNDEVNNFAAGCNLGRSVQGAIYEAEAKLKEKNSD